MKEHKTITITVFGESMPDSGVFKTEAVQIDAMAGFTHLDDIAITCLVAYRKMAAAFIETHPKDCPDCSALDFHKRTLRAIDEVGEESLSRNHNLLRKIFGGEN